MKKIFLFAMVAALIAVGCSKNDDGGTGSQTLVLDFEGDAWTALVDNPQYNGPLLYGDGYSWHDPETDLYSELTNSCGDNTFWGGGVDTQNVLPFGKPEEVREQVLYRLDIFSKGGGYIFNTIHNIQANVPVENIVAMVDAVKEFNGDK